MRLLPLASAFFASVSCLVAQTASEEAWFSLEPGDTWAFEDDTGKMEIRVLEEGDVGEGGKALRVGWFIDGSEEPYQAEYWRKEGSDYLVFGREIAGRKLLFEEPYVFLKESVKPGDSWSASLRFGGREVKLKFLVGEKEMIKTPAGTFEAIKIGISGPPQTVERWYAPKVGMVQEITRLTLGGRTSPGNEKKLIRHVDGGAEEETEK